MLEQNRSDAGQGFGLEWVRVEVSPTGRNEFELENISQHFLFICIYSLMKNNVPFQFEGFMFGHMINPICSLPEKDGVNKTSNGEQHTTYYTT